MVNYGNYQIKVNYALGSETRWLMFNHPLTSVSTQYIMLPFHAKHKARNHVVKGH